MKTYHWNGEHWYERDWSLLHHIRTWVIWIGGWEKPNGAGWQFRHRHNGKLKRPTPIALFGHRVKIQGWGWSLRLGRGRHLVYSRLRGRKLYISPDGTPQNAVCWWYGAPGEVRDAVERKG